MPRFCANLTFLFRELPLVDRFAAARDAGFDAVELLWPEEETTPPEAIARKLQESGLPLALINTPRAGQRGRHWGLAASNGGEQSFDDALDATLARAALLKPRHIHILAGIASGAGAEARYVCNLRRACDRAPDQSFTIEPINRVTLPGYFLDSFETAARVIDAVARPNLGLQFDTFHAQRISGDMPALWRRYGRRAVHVQVASSPDRHEPAAQAGPGGIDHPAFFARLDREGYTGFVSGEYHPRADTAAGLNWLITED